MNQETLDDKFERILLKLEPDFTKHFDITAKAETGGYLDIALRHRKNKHIIQFFE